MKITLWILLSQMQAHEGFATLHHSFQMNEEKNKTIQRENHAKMIYVCLAQKKFLPKFSVLHNRYND